MSRPFRTAFMISAFVLSSLSAAGQMKLSGNKSARTSLEPESYTLVKPRELYSEDTIRIAVLGDIMLHRKQIKQALSEGTDTLAHDSYGFNSFNIIRERLEEADLTIGNMEFTLSGPPFTGYPSFSAPDSYAEYMARNGIDVFLTANNHILDKGPRGADRTLGIYRSMEKEFGIRYAGTSSEGDDSHNPLIIDIKGVRIALVNLTYGTNRAWTRSCPSVGYLRSMDPYFKLARESEAEVIIALPHWGEEYKLNPSQVQRHDAHKMIDRGADLIIGAHPHVVQDIEKIRRNGKVVDVLYSLGNAVSNMSAKNTQIGLLAEFDIIKKINGKIKVGSPELTWLWCSRPGGYNNSYTVLPVMEYISRKDEWKGKWDYDKMIATWKNVSLQTGIPLDGKIKKN